MKGIKNLGMKKLIGSRKRGAPMPKMMATPKAMKPLALEGQTALPGLKKGGSVKNIVGKGKSPAAARADYVNQMKAAGKKPLPAAKKPRGGIGIMIILGKKGK